MNDNRYQYQNRWVKFGRWLRYRPWTLVRFLFWFVQWCVRGCEQFKFNAGEDDPGWAMSKWETVEFLWSIYKSEANYKMQWYFTSKEVFADLRAQSNEYYTEAAVSGHKN